jgi:hypothetical protein
MTCNQHYDRTLLAAATNLLASSQDQLAAAAVHNSEQTHANDSAMSWSVGLRCLVIGHSSNLQCMLQSTTRNL